jgi:hypothetical protein
MLKTFISNVIFPKDNLSTIFLQLINILEVVRNKRPKIIGIELHVQQVVYQIQ